MSVGVVVVFEVQILKCIIFLTIFNLDETFEGKKNVRILKIRAATTTAHAMCLCTDTHPH